MPAWLSRPEPSRRTGSENDFGRAKHAGFVEDWDSDGVARAELSEGTAFPQPGTSHCSNFNILVAPDERPEFRARRPPRIQRTGSIGVTTPAGPRWPRQASAQILAETAAR